MMLVVVRTLSLTPTAKWQPWLMLEFSDLGDHQDYLQYVKKFLVDLI